MKALKRVLGEAAAQIAEQKKEALRVIPYDSGRPEANMTRIRTEKNFNNTFRPARGSPPNQSSFDLSV